MTAPALRIEGVGFVADQGEVILEGIDWTLERGSAGAVIGPSGSGKSTLVRLINGLDSPSSGMLEVLDPHSNYLDPRSFRKMRARQEGSFFGIGIIISRRNGEITVIAPIAGTPAAEAGLLAGRQRMLRMRFQPGVVNPCHFRLGLQPFRQDLGITAMSLHAQAQGF